MPCRCARRSRSLASASPTSCSLRCGARSAPSARERDVAQAPDARGVFTLDAGGTNLVFSALSGAGELVEPVSLPSQAHDLDACLGQIRAGFQALRDRAPGKAVALSLAFPGPADYARGVIGDLGNLPAFRGGVALGPMLEDLFSLPVFVNNDGDPCALGEARAGLLPWVTARLEASGSAKRYRNLLGVTLGTGFGAGIVHDGRLLLGDNGAAGEIWLLRNKLDRGSFAEEGVSIRAVRRVYARNTGVPLEEVPEPRVLEAANPAAARGAFRRLGEVLGDALANALTLIDGLAVIGGGLSGAAPLFLPALMAELNGTLEAADGSPVTRLEMRAFNLEDPAELTSFLTTTETTVRVPGSARSVPYDPAKKVGVGLSRLGTSRAVALGAHAFALDALD